MLRDSLTVYPMLNSGVLALISKSKYTIIGKLFSFQLERDLRPSTFTFDFFVSNFCPSAQYCCIVRGDKGHLNSAKKKGSRSMLLKLAARAFEL